MQSTVVKIDQNVSRNFQMAKVFSILMVVVGHYFREFGMLWVPVTIGLLVFSFSSSYFTYLKYNANFDVKIFWLNKAERLGAKLLVINIFLLTIFMIDGRSGIWTWQTIVNLLGMNGFLNWFGIQNPSPFGAGMWFFTLLLIFYLLYPSLGHLNRTKVGSCVLFFSSVLIAFYLHIRINPGHALWLTACGFIAGIFFARNGVKIRNHLGIVGFIFCLGLMIYFNHFLGIKDYNFFFILSCAIFCILLLIDLKLPDAMFRGMPFFSGCILEVYLIHPYLLYRGTGYLFVDLVFSLLIIIISAALLHLISLEIGKRIESRFNEVFSG